MFREHEIDLHPVVEELNKNSSLIDECIIKYTKIQLRNIIIIGLIKDIKI